jgi:mitochondrial inner membrane protease ATP23
MSSSSSKSDQSFNESLDVRAPSKESTNFVASKDDDDKATPTRTLPVVPPQPVHTNEAEASTLCNKWVESGIAKNKSLQHLLQTLVDSGCTPPEGFIKCVQCEQPQAGGFGMVLEEILDSNKSTSSTAASLTASKDQCQRTAQELREQIQREQSGTSRLTLQPEVFVCQQYMKNEQMAHRTVHHELIHAIDMCRTKMDPLHNCVHLACTEIRAENLSGECSFWKELPRMSSFIGHGKECVRRRAILSVKANPNCTARAEEYVDASLPRCFQDTYPYDRHPNQR